MSGARKTYVGTCSVDACTGPLRARKTLCEKHYQRLHRHGDVHHPGRQHMPRLEAHWKWTGSDGSYNAVHHRLTKKRGPARAQTCACGAPAKHWAYDHTDPDERAGADGPFSTDLARYRPMCVPCHKALDLAHLARKENA